jgi:hypothetical protein
MAAALFFRSADYWLRSAVTGSIEAARLAGTKAASTAAITSVPNAPPRISGF